MNHTFNRQVHQPCHYSNTISLNFTTTVRQLKYPYTFLFNKLENVTWSFFIGSSYFAGLNSSPDEDRLLKHLFDPDYQTHNLQTTPVSNINETINVTVGIEIRKLIAVVTPGNLFTSNCLSACQFINKSSTVAEMGDSGHKG